jgi:uncharacterized protein
VNEVLAILVAAAGGFAGGLLGVGGGILFVPALTIFLDLPQLDAEATSLLVIIPVAIAGTLNQNRYGNVRMRDAMLVAACSPLGVVAGVIAANELPARALELCFAALALYFAARLVRRAMRPQPGAAP